VLRAEIVDLRRLYDAAEEEDDSELPRVEDAPALLSALHALRAENASARAAAGAPEAEGADAEYSAQQHRIFEELEEGAAEIDDELRALAAAATGAPPSARALLRPLNELLDQAAAVDRWSARPRRRARRAGVRCDGHRKPGHGSTERA